MAGKLRDEIKQTVPFPSPAVEAFLNLQRTAAVLLRAVSETLKPHRLTHQQYNVLRILRGAGRDGCPCRQVGERLVTPVPDVTRILDRLEKRGLVERSRGVEDRRVVNVTISRDGRNALRRLDAPVLAAHERCLGHLGERKLNQLIRLLEEAREPGTETGP